MIPRAARSPAWLPSWNSERRKLFLGDVVPRELRLRALKRSELIIRLMEWTCFLWVLAVPHCLSSHPVLSQIALASPVFLYFFSVFLFQLYLRFSSSPRFPCQSPLLWHRRPVSRHQMVPALSHLSVTSICSLPCHLLNLRHLPVSVGKYTYHLTCVFSKWKW